MVFDIWAWGFVSHSSAEVKSSFKPSETDKPSLAYSPPEPKCRLLSAILWHHILATHQGLSWNLTTSGGSQECKHTDLQRFTSKGC